MARVNEDATEISGPYLEFADFKLKPGDVVGWQEKNGVVFTGCIASIEEPVDEDGKKTGEVRVTLDNGPDVAKIMDRLTAEYETLGELLGSGELFTDE